MRDYGKIYTRFWTDPDIGQLSSDAKLLACYLLSGPHTTALGAFRLPIGYISTDLGKGFETVTEPFAQLLKIGFATYCEQTHWVFIHRFLKWNPPENPNQITSVQKLFHEVPQHAVFHDELRVLLEGFGQNPSNPSERVKKRFRNQEQEQEQEQEQKRKESTADAVDADAAAPASPPALRLISPPCPYSAIVDIYHEVLPELRECRSLTSARKGYLRQRWMEKPGPDLTRWRKFFEYVSTSPFLMGQCDGRDGRPPFVADLEWLTKPANFVKIIEGKFEPAVRYG